MFITGTTCVQFIAVNNLIVIMSVYYVSTEHLMLALVTVIFHVCTS